ASEPVGLGCSLEVPARPSLRLALREVLHLAAKEAGLRLEAADALQGLVRKAVELARVDEQTNRELLTVILEHVLVARHSAARDLHLGEAADTPFEDVDRSAHRGSNAN